MPSEKVAGKAKKPGTKNPKGKAPKSALKEAALRPKEAKGTNAPPFEVSPPVFGDFPDSKPELTTKRDAKAPAKLPAAKGDAKGAKAPGAAGKPAKDQAGGTTAKDTKASPGVPKLTPKVGPKSPMVGSKAVGNGPAKGPASPSMGGRDIATEGKMVKKREARAVKVTTPADVSDELETFAKLEESIADLYRQLHKGQEAVERSRKDLEGEIKGTPNDELQQAIVAFNLTAQAYGHLAPFAQRMPNNILVSMRNAIIETESEAASLWQWMAASYLMCITLILMLLGLDSGHI